MFSKQTLLYWYFRSCLCMEVLNMEPKKYPFSLPLSLAYSNVSFISVFVIFSPAVERPIDTRWWRGKVLACMTTLAELCVTTGQSPLAGWWTIALPALAALKHLNWSDRNNETFILKGKLSHLNALLWWLQRHCYGCKKVLWWKLPAGVCSTPVKSAQTHVLIWKCSGSHSVVGTPLLHPFSLEVCLCIQFREFRIPLPLAEMPFSHLCGSELWWGTLNIKPPSVTWSCAYQALSPDL